MKAKAALIVGLVLFSSLTSALAFEVRVSEAPSSNLALTISSIRGAHESVLLNSYELNSQDIASALVERIQAGVKVMILSEGEPVGGLSSAALTSRNQILKAMAASQGGHRFFEMTSRASMSAKRRFRFNHGKYAVIDGASLMIGSENYTPTGNPVPGTPGNRGWQVLVREPKLSADFTRLFASDADMSHGDVLDLTALPPPAGGEYVPQDRGLFCIIFGINCSDTDVNRPRAVVLEPVSLEASAAFKILSPETSLPDLITLIDSARTTLEIQQMAFNSTWDKEPSGASPLFQAVLQAARRGVRVRVLLNDESVFATPDKPRRSRNFETVELLSQAALREKLPLQALIADVKAMGVEYIHNKGVLVDGDKTLISSINWNWNSVVNNRETALVITSPAVHNHYRALFDLDWKASVVTEGSLPNLVDLTDCPRTLRVRAAIGKLTAVEPTDSSYASLSNSVMEVRFTRAAAKHGCLLIELDPSEKKFRNFQISKRRDGRLGLILEGYTSDGRMYSIRSALPQPIVQGPISSGVFDGPGLARRRLGGAVFTIFSH